MTTDDLSLLQLVEGKTRVPASDEDLADAYRTLVARSARELAGTGLSAEESEAEAFELVAEAVGVSVEELRRRMEPPAPL